MTDPSQPEPFAAPYVLNPSSVTIQNDDQGWPASPPPPRPPRQRPWLIPVVILGVLALIGGLVFAGAAELQALGGRGFPIMDPVFPSATAEAPTSTPAATTCPPACFTVASAGSLIPDGSLEGSMPVIGGQYISADFQHPTTAAQEYSTDAASWAASSTRPASCFFIDSRSPISPALGGIDAPSSDPVTFLGETSDRSGGSTMTQTARFFSSSAAATDYQRRLMEQILACHVADDAINTASGFDLPDSITAVSFVEIGASTTTYVYDFQRANVIVRFRVVTSDHVDENAVRHFLGTWVATGLAQLDPH